MVLVFNRLHRVVLITSLDDAAAVVCAQDTRWSAVKRIFVKKHDATNDSAFVDSDVV